jgi:hypothetical protein
VARNKMTQGASMKHSSTRELFDYWNRRRGNRPAPERGEIEPGAIRHVLADTFILAIDPAAGHPFRIAGTRVCAAFGRELKGVSFTDLWAGASRDCIRELLDTVAAESFGVIATASAQGCDGSARKLELIVLPLAHRGGTNARILGALVPTELPFWLGVSTLGPMTLGTIRHLGRETDPEPSHVGSGPTPGRHAHRGLVVYDGGHV